MGERVEAGWSFSGSWYIPDLLFLPTAFQIHFVPLPCERDYYNQSDIAKLKVKRAGIFLISIICGRLASFKIAHASSHGTRKRDWLDPEMRESRLGSSGPCSALICFSRTSSDLFFPTSFFRMANPLGILLILRSCSQPSQRESLLGVPFFFAFFFF